MIDWFYTPQFDWYTLTIICLKRYNSDFRTGSYTTFFGTCHIHPYADQHKHSTRYKHVNIYEFFKGHSLMYSAPHLVSLPPIHKYHAPGGGGGGTRGVRHTGVCRSNRSLFWEKSLNIGYGFELENLKHTPPPPPHFCNIAVDTRYFRPFRR